MTGSHLIEKIKKVTGETALENVLIDNKHRVSQLNFNTFSVFLNVTWPRPTKVVRPRLRPFSLRVSQPNYFCFISHPFMKCNPYALCCLPLR